ncbi:helix-turn-helix domain-containing protein [Capnocytophaga stomatis]|uniref:Helix-turn-helix domain-containing protein n=1 Tax=Capnocytophaga stomatis TaxID=1848904 RepID=A0A250FTC8_9FLAO|nr:helix-turn-helix transcriptional regulator [Capnocytophaga stomatis]ATA88324.1 transcriptional regulator [Capnocytophaga stomatis]GIJ93015.1 transcriptional regulator [Capnocytophaga stomatis]GIJ96277.1 transcriptional regulator [Capnocytophaga stomatis]GIM49295.1 transcriptional regulator [Capnocytophaga stomatis]
MINISDFTKRLQKVMDYYGLSASAFADTLDIQRSSISHLLSERNKPSLDFILKLVSKFPEVDIYWITQGKGEFPISTSSTDKSVKQSFQTDLFEEKSSQNVINNPVITENKEPELPIKQEKTDKKIKKIIFFYEDNSFEIFENL